MVKVDHHAAVKTLRVKYTLARKAMKNDQAEEAELQALDAVQESLESLSPKTLSISCIQGLLHSCLARLAHYQGHDLYCGAVLVFFYSVGGELKGEFSDGLYSVA